MEKQVFNLWDGEIPGYIDGEEIPILTYYPSNNKRGHGAVLICAGGGYSHRALHEGEGYALYLNDQGLDTFVVNYRVLPYRFPCALTDARRAIRFIRKNADKFGINPDKIAIMGSSAGGHLSALVSTYRGKTELEGIDELDTVNCRPNFQILCYPVIEAATGHPGTFINLLGDKEEELRDTVTPSLIADSDTPPAFIWHTATDPIVNVTNTYNYAKRLRELEIPVELHIYPLGKHGLGLAPQEENKHIRSWARLLVDWLDLMGFYS